MSKKEIIVAAAILIKNKKILIAKRRKNDFSGNKWEFPGGKIEKNESPQECLRRELKEEFGITTKIGNFFYLSKHNYSFYSIKMLTYFAALEQGEIELKEHEDIKWVTQKELTKFEMPEVDIQVVRDLIKIDLDSCAIF